MKCKKCNNDLIKENPRKISIEEIEDTIEGLPMKLRYVYEEIWRCDTCEIYVLKNLSSRDYYPREN